MPKRPSIYKGSDCLVCPICAQLQKPTSGFLNALAALARRALQNKGIATLQQLSIFTKANILSFHGMGKSSIPKLKKSIEGSRFIF